MYWENLYNKKNKVNKPVELDYFQQEKVKEYRQLADDANRWLDLPTVPSRLSSSGISIPGFLHEEQNVRNMQAALGVEEDGDWGPVTEKAFRTTLINQRDGAENAISEIFAAAAAEQERAEKAQPQLAYGTAQVGQYFAAPASVEKPVYLTADGSRTNVPTGTSPKQEQVYLTADGKRTNVPGITASPASSGSKGSTDTAAYDRTMQTADASRLGSTAKNTLAAPSYNRTALTADEPRGAAAERQNIYFTADGKRTNVAGGARKSLGGNMKNGVLKLQTENNNKAWDNEKEIAQWYDDKIDIVNSELFRIQSTMRHTRNGEEWLELQKQAKELNAKINALGKEKTQAIDKYRKSVSFAYWIRNDTTLRDAEKESAITAYHDLPDDKKELLTQMLSELGPEKVFSGYNWETAASILLEGESGYVPIVEDSVDMTQYSYVRPRIGSGEIEKTKSLGIEYSYYYYNEADDQYHFDVYQNGVRKATFNLGKYPPYDLVVSADYHVFNKWDEFEIQKQTAFNYWLGLPNILSVGSTYLLGEDIIGYIPPIEDYLNAKYREDPTKADRSNYYFAVAEVKYRHH
ncbi:MAG: hypothetical protein IJB22_01245, partial [Clostridia bacterium]|nr:hypothetical protein [Clostridia bacterium]